MATKNTEDGHLDEDGMPQIVDTQSDFERKVEENKVLIVAGLCLLVVVSAGLFVLRHLSERKLQAANLAFTAAQTIDDYNLVIDDHGGTVAAGNAYLAKAQAMIDAGRSDEAHQVLRKFIELYEDHPRHAQAFLALGTLLEASGNPEGAAGRYRELVTLHSGSELVPYAKIRIADLRWSEGKDDEARILYEEIPPAHPRTGQTWVSKIEARLTLIGKGSPETDASASNEVPEAEDVVLPSEGGALVEEAVSEPAG